MAMRRRDVVCPSAQGPGAGATGGLRSRIVFTAFRSSVSGEYSLAVFGFSKIYLPHQPKPESQWTVAYFSLQPPGYNNSTLGSGSAFSNPGWGKSTLGQRSCSFQSMVHVHAWYLLVFAFPSPAPPPAHPEICPRTTSSHPTNPAHPRPHSPRSSTLSRQNTFSPMTSSPGAGVAPTVSVPFLTSFARLGLGTCALSPSDDKSDPESESESDSDRIGEGVRRFRVAAADEPGNGDRPAPEDEPLLLRLGLMALPLASGDEAAVLPKVKEDTFGEAKLSFGLEELDPLGLAGDDAELGLWAEATPPGLATGFLIWTRETIGPDEPDGLPEPPKNDIVIDWQPERPCWTRDFSTSTIYSVEPMTPEVLHRTQC